MEEDGQDEKPSGSFFFRHRSPAFSREEAKILLNIIDKYKTIVLNKSTTASASHAKDTTWLKISKIYNRQGFKHVRSVDNLKIKWDNMKKEARKVSKNFTDLRYSEFDELNSQLVAMMCEVENNGNHIEEPVESDSDLNETENHKDSNNINYNGIDHKDSDDSSFDDDPDRDNKRNRSLNFSPDECNLLLQCVRQEKNIIFSKTNTSSFNKVKNRAWERITNSFNKLSPQKRSSKILRTKFANMKTKAKSTNYKKYFKQFKKKEDSANEIKPEPLFDYRSSVDVDDDDFVNDRNDFEDKSNSDVNTTLDPLSTVLNSDLGSISQFENKEIVKLKLELLNYKMETAKLKRKRLEDLMQADLVERESRARETSLRLRAARLEAVAAEMKFPPEHPALAYTADEVRAQNYTHHYHTS